MTYYEKNKIKILKYQNLYNKKNKEKIREYQRKYWIRRKYKLNGWEEMGSTFFIHENVEVCFE
jgi:hypothetical protein